MCIKWSGGRFCSINLILVGQSAFDGDFDPSEHIRPGTCYSCLCIPVTPKKWPVKIRLGWTLPPSCWKYQYPTHECLTVQPLLFSKSGSLKTKKKHQHLPSVSFSSMAFSSQGSASSKCSAGTSARGSKHRWVLWRSIPKQINWPIGDDQPPGDLTWHNPTFMEKRQIIFKSVLGRYIISYFAGGVSVWWTPPKISILWCYDY